jgi:hypothetical protein
MLSAAKHPCHRETLPVEPGIMLVDVGMNKSISGLENEVESDFSACHSEHNEESLVPLQSGVMIGMLH